MNHTKISKYQIVEELGRGGMGCVYKAFDPEMDKYVALKVILTHDKEEEKLLQRFIREARTMAKMNHPNIVKVYNFKEEQDCPYFTMDYIEGCSLRKFLEDTKPNIRLFSQLIVKIAEAVAYAHHKGIIHRDLKPSNVMIDKNGEPLVMDFGLAKLIEVDQSLSGYPLGAGAIMGTPQYMSPQQACGEEVDYRSDVYALGAIFYEMISGKPLIEASGIERIIYKIIHEEPILLRKLNNKLAKDLETICHKAIAKELNQRYQSAQEFSEDVKRFLHGELIKAKAVGLWQRSWHKVYKNKLITITTLTGALLVLVGIFLFKKQHTTKLYLHLNNAEEWQQKANTQEIAEKQMEIYWQFPNCLITQNGLDCRRELDENAPERTHKH